MKCIKCKEMLNLNDICSNCGKKNDIISVIWYVISNVLLYGLSFIFMLLFLVLLTDSATKASLIMLIPTIFACPFTYNFMCKYIKFIKKWYIRTLLIIIPFIFAMNIWASSNTDKANINDNNQNISIDTSQNQEDTNVVDIQPQEDTTESKEEKELEEKIAKLEEEKRLAEEATREAEARKRLEEYRKQEEQRKEQEKQEGLNTFVEIKRAFDNNEISATDKYCGKRYTLYGEVVGIEESGLFNTLLNTIGVTISVNHNGEYFYAFCSFDKSQRDKLSSINKGEYILFTGICDSWGVWDECQLK